MNWCAMSTDGVGSFSLTISLPSMTSENSSPSLCSPDTAPLRRAKIICTLGPSCNTEASIRGLLQVGMDVARLNFSHGKHEEHALSIEALRRAAAAEGRTVCVLQDLQGPKIRTGTLQGRTPVTLRTGAMVTITIRDVEGSAELISTNFKGLPNEVHL